MNSAWQKFNERVAIPRHPEGGVTLTVRAGGAQFAFANWQAVNGKTHVVYHVDTEKRRIGIEFIDELEASGEDLAIAYKISRNGYKQFHISCTRLLKLIPFPLVEMKKMPRGGLEAGKWFLETYEEGGLIVIESEAEKTRNLPDN